MQDNNISCVTMEYKVVENHIEIYFDGVPSGKIRDTLKACGWYWLGKKKCWSNANNSENLIWAKMLSKEINPERNNLRDKFEKVEIKLTDLIVRCNGFYCNQHHELVDMAGEIEVLDKKDNIHICLIPIVYCKTCNVYYVLEETYLELKKKGRIRAEILTLKAYQNGERTGFGELSSISPLREWGYTVSQAEGYNDRQRQSVLEDIVDYGILSKDEVLSYLDFFIKLNYHKGSIALDKWKLDRDYIAQYRIGSSKKMRVGKIIVFDKK